MNTFTVQSIDVSELTPIVQRSVGCDTLSIQEWQVSQLGGGAGNPVSLGLYRFEGIGRDEDKLIPWSVILKVIQSPANVGQQDMGGQEEPTHWNYWKREPFVYRSGLLENLPDGMAAPRCFSVVEMPGDIICLWLEDVSDPSNRPWTLDRYALAARHLGRLNGVYLDERPLPSFPWLSRRRLEQWINLIPWRTFPWEHPKARTHYPRLESNSFQRMLAEHERFLAMLEKLPQTICHNDTYPTNFMSRDLPDGQQQTVILDWALTGIAPVGADLGQFIFGAENNLEEVSRDEIDTVLFESYMAGLRDSNCNVDRQLVRFGYTAYAALHVGLFQVFLLGTEIEGSETMGEPAAEPIANPECFEVKMAAEAYRLLDVI